MLLRVVGDLSESHMSVSAIELWWQSAGPPTVVFQTMGRIWQLGLVNAWRDLQQAGHQLPSLPRFLVAHNRSRVENILKERPASFVILTMQQEHAKSFLVNLMSLKDRFPTAGFAVVAPRGHVLEGICREYGAHCVVSSPRELKKVAIWLAWHLRRLPPILNNPRAQIWDRLPWSQWDSRKNMASSS